MSELIKNGIVVQRTHSGLYQGIEGDNWYFNYLNTEEDFETFFNDAIDIAWSDNHVVDCCTDLRYIIKYAQESRALDIEYRLLFCETEMQYPVFSENCPISMEFIGFDYAYAGGSYYCFWQSPNRALRNLIFRAP